MANPEVLRRRDEILEALLYSIASDDVLSDELVLQGGGALHFIYGSPRYSTDLDFVSENFPTIQDRLQSRLTTLLSERGIIPRIKSNRDGDVLRAAYPLGDQLPSGKVEITHQVSFDHAPTTGKYAPLLVEAPTELYADKLAANLIRLATRGSIKGTDLYDLDYLRTQFKTACSEAGLREKAASYDRADVVTPSQLQEIATHIRDPANHEGFARAIRRTLMPDVAKSITLDATYFRNAATHFEQF